MPAIARSCLVACLAILWTAGGAALAEDDAVDTAAGLALAEARCAECHVITADYSKLMGVAEEGSPPGFYAVANDPAVTEIALRAFLHTPHHAMPNLILSEAEMASIIDYILSLREP